MTQEAVIPHTITPQQAADALGLRLAELARNLDTAISDRLTRLGVEISDGGIRLDDFDEAIGHVRRLLESSTACWDTIDEGRDTA